jgi:hypothetical protein
MQAAAPEPEPASDSDITPETERLFDVTAELQPEPEPIAAADASPPTSPGAQTTPLAQTWSEVATGEPDAPASGMSEMPTSGPVGETKGKGKSFFGDPRFVRHLSSVFTPRFVAYISFSHHLVKGVLAGGGSSGMVLSQRNIYVIKGIPARDKQLFTAAASTPWAIKPVLGLINDTLPIKGWEKSLYLLGAACAGSAAWLTIGLFGEELPGEMICICFLTILTQVAWTDLMVRGDQRHPSRCPSECWPPLSRPQALSHPLADEGEGGQATHTHTHARLG